MLMACVEPWGFTVTELIMLAAAAGNAAKAASVKRADTAMSRFTLRKQGFLLLLEY
jgi:hypothetical protein